MKDFEGIVALCIPIAICVVLPVMVVWITFRAQMNRDNKRTEVLIKAIESNNGIDADKLAEAMSKPRKTASEILNQRLLRGCIFSLVGLALMISSVIMGIGGEDMFDNVPGLFLFTGLASVAVGISYLIVYFVTRGKVAGDMER